MRLALPLALAAVLGTTAASTADPRAKLDEALAGLTPIRTTKCVSSYDLRRAAPQAYGKTLLFRVSGSRVIRTDTAGGCERVGFDEALTQRRPVDRLCEGDFGLTVERLSGFGADGCRFGKFTEYRRPKS